MIARRRLAYPGWQLAAPGWARRFRRVAFVHSQAQGSASDVERTAKRAARDRRASTIRIEAERHYGGLRDR